LFSGFFNSVLFIAGIPNCLCMDTHSRFYSYILDFLTTQSHHHTLDIKVMPMPAVCCYMSVQLCLVEFSLDDMVACGLSTLHCILYFVQHSCKFNTICIQTDWSSSDCILMIQINYWLRLMHQSDNGEKIWIPCDNTSTVTDFKKAYDWLTVKFCTKFPFQ
jgi:hypothetical protein